MRSYYALFICNRVSKLILQYSLAMLDSFGVVRTFSREQISRTLMFIAKLVMFTEKNTRSEDTSSNIQFWLLRDFFRLGCSNRWFLSNFLSIIWQRTSLKWLKDLIRNFCSAIFDLTNTISLKQIIFPRYEFVFSVNSTDFMIKISLLQICFINNFITTRMF